MDKTGTERSRSELLRWVDFCKAAGSGTAGPGNLTVELPTRRPEGTLVELGLFRGKKYMVWFETVWIDPFCARANPGPSPFQEHAKYRNTTPSSRSAHLTQNDRELNLSNTWKLIRRGSNALEHKQGQA